MDWTSPYATAAGMSEGIIVAKEGFNLDILKTISSIPTLLSRVNQPAEEAGRSVSSASSDCKTNLFVSQSHGLLKDRSSISATGTLGVKSLE